MKRLNVKDQIDASSRVHDLMEAPTTGTGSLPVIDCIDSARERNLGSKPGQTPGTKFDLALALVKRAEGGRGFESHLGADGYRPKCLVAQR
jgi:hypothetical protein